MPKTKTEAFSLPGKRRTADPRVRGKAGKTNGPTSIDKTHKEVVQTTTVSERGPSHGLFVEGSVRATKFKMLIDTGLPTR